jgi:hypothetical protein
MNTSSQTSEIDDTDLVDLKIDRRWALLLGLFVIALTLIPYLVGYSMANGRQYMWLGYNLDDSCVYLSWMRQVRDGSVRQFNLFTTESQHGMVVNPLFLLLGVAARITGLPLIAVYHISRLLFGLALLLVVWRLIETLLGDRRTRKLAYLFVCLSAGFGWLPLWWQESSLNTPVDRWQPEAITFLSLYLSPLFCCSLALQAAVILLLFHGERTRQLRPAIWAGLCAFALGLIHTYDVMSLSAVWLTYLIVNTVRPIRGTTPPPSISWRNGLAAGALAAPAIIYVYLQLRTETVFKQRAAVPTWSPPVAWVLLGFGGVLILAMFAIYQMAKSGIATSSASSDLIPDQQSLHVPHDVARLLLVWAVANLAISYVPTEFQRKLLQGEHFPIAILGGIGAAWLFARMRLRGWQFWTAATGLTLLLGITNYRFAMRDIENDEINLSQTRQQRPYLQHGEIEALEWIDRHVPKAVAIQPLPYLELTSPDADGHRKIAAKDMSVACFLPGLTGHKVYCGHWGETPYYGDKLKELQNFARPQTTDQQRIDLLRHMKVGYIVYSQKDANDTDADLLAPMFRSKVTPPDYLKLVYSNRDADIYRVDPSAYSAVLGASR